MADDIKERLIKLLLEKSFRYSEEATIKLASGKMSNYYIDCRKTTYSPEGQYLVGNIIFEMIKDLKIDAIGGLTMGADPISCSVAFASHTHKNDIGSFAIRKERKEHGMQKQVEGDVKEGDRVVIIDDVITTGGSTVKAIEAAKREGLDIVKVIVLVDREEGGKEKILEHVSEVEAVCTKSELLEAYKKNAAS
jgi:orotate phosphoribosyltransferase